MASKVTTCVTCGVPVKYATKKPKWCAKCKKLQPKVYKPSKRKAPPAESKNELIMKRTLNQLLPNEPFIDNGYYSMLPSPKGSPLQLDRYYPDLRLAFEYDGKQHAEYVPFIHKTPEAFAYLQSCDQVKNQHCKRLGIRLIRIAHDVVITKTYLEKRLQAAGIMN